MIILDTDHVSLLNRGPSASADRLRHRIAQARQTQPVVTTIITYEEQIRGWFRLLAQAKTMPAIIEAYRRLRIHADNYKLLTIIDFDEHAAIEFQKLKVLKIRIGTMDLRIASIAISQQAILWSRNFQDFHQVPGLSLEDGTL